MRELRKTKLKRKKEYNKLIDINSYSHSMLNNICVSYNRINTYRLKMLVDEQLKYQKNLYINKISQDIAYKMLEDGVIKISEDISSDGFNYLNVEVKVVKKQ